MTDYATVLMTVLAAEPVQLHSAHELAQRTRVAEPTVGKLLKLLTRGGLIESIRGAHGGYRLARPADRITVGDIVSALQGPVALTQCSEHASNCTIEAHCGVRTSWRVINDTIRAALETVTLAQMAAPARPTPREFPLLPAKLLQAAR